MKLQEKFDFLEDLLLNKRESIGLHTGVPFIMLIYDPKKEYDCREEIKTLEEKLLSRNLNVLTLPINKFIFEYLKKDGKLEEIFEYEKESPAEVREELFNLCKYYLRDYVLEKIESRKPDIVFVTNVASLYPYYRVSNMFYSLENDVKVPFVVFYPGEVKEDGKLYFLGELASSEYYRALII
jgi:hypothetical protein